MSTQKTNSSAIRAIYQKALRPVLFKVDPENIHEAVLSVGGVFARNVLGRSILDACFGFEDERLKSDLFGLSFKNPFGLAAGFDKNCIAVELFGALGFGHIEVGTITAQSQPGNPRPRIFRFPADKALINRMGFPSEGVDVVAARLQQLRRSDLPCLIGVNIGKTKVVPVDDALPDYLASFEKVKKLGDYFVLNVSSPNTPELRKLQERGRLEQLFKGVSAINTARRPLLVKIAPDLSWQEVDDVLDVAMQSGVSGIIATNTTITREGLSVATDQAGGLSGQPLKHKSRQMVAYLYKQTSGKLPIIGVGGVANLEDALEMFAAGASLIQIYTGLIYQGPDMIKSLKKGLCNYMINENIHSLRDLIGSKVK